MSSTRYATGGPLRQNRFASSPEFERGLIANMVAKRCTLLERAADRELLWFLQLLSHQEGGLNQFVAQLCERNSGRIGSPSMLKFGSKPGQLYSASQVKTVRAEIPDGEDQFPLQGELTSGECVAVPECHPHDEYLNPEAWRRAQDLNSQHQAASRARPTGYPAAEFKALALKTARAELEEHLQRLCLDPATRLDVGPWYFPELATALRDFQVEWIAEHRPAVVTTNGKKIHEALDYALAKRLLVLIDGETRTGKSHATVDWVNQHPGCVRYVPEVPPGNDDVGFFRAIAKALGISHGLGLKSVELRERIEDTLQSGDLMLLLDEGHYCLPTNGYRHALPGRINWILTALVNHGVAVAIITTPQFLKTQKTVETRTNWNAGQFIGRIGHYEKLPDTLPRRDLEAVARVRLPGAPADAIEALVIYASNSKKYLAGIKAVADRAQYQVEKAGRSKVELLDVMRAIDESVIPSDAAFAEAMSATAKPARKRVVNIEPPSALARRSVAPANSLSRPVRGMRPVADELATAPA